MAKKMTVKKVDSNPLLSIRKVPRFKFKKLPSVRLFSQNLEFSPKDKVTISYERNLRPSSGIIPVNRGIEKTEGWECDINHVSGTVTSDHLVEINDAVSKIFIGGVYNIKDLVAGSAKTLPFARKPITILIDSHHFKTASVRIEKPFKQDIREAVNKILRSKDMPDTAVSTGKMGQFDSVSSLLTNFSGSGHYLGFGGSHKIKFDSRSKTHKFYLEAKQLYYTLSVNNDVNEPEDFFHLKEEGGDVEDSISKVSIDPNWVYVDSVGYGRMLYFIFESDESYEGMDLDLKQYADYLAAAIELKEEVREKIQNKNVSMQVFAMGGSPLIVGVLTGADTENFRKEIVKYFKEKNAEVPISYSLCTLDNQAVGTHLYVDYDSRKCHPIPTKYKVVWESVSCQVNDDGGDGEQVRAMVRIRALDQSGKDVLDEDKLNLNLINHIKLETGMWKDVWTFSKGNSDNPLYLKERRPVYMNKSITFPMKGDKRIVKFGIRADITEYDVGPNDDFHDDSLHLKVNEINPDKLYTVTCRHEASEIVFGFRVIPIYN